MSRILLQRSVFIIGCLLIPDNEGIVRKIRIAKDDKQLLLKDLELLDITQSSLFQDVYGFSQAQNSTMQLEDSKEYFRQGNQFNQRGNYAKAIESYNKSIISDPNNSETYFSRGNAKAVSGDHEKAIKDYDEAISIALRNQPYPNSDPSTLVLTSYPLLLMVYFNRDNSKSELTNYEGALKDYTEAIRWRRKYHDHSNLHYNRANTYMRLCNVKKALAEYDKIRLKSAHSLFNKGNALMVLGRFDEALQHYEELELKGMKSDIVGSNRVHVKNIKDKIGSRDFDIYIEQRKNGTNTINVLVRIAEGRFNSQNLLFYGNAGNVGNFGGAGFPGGKGLQGDSFMRVRVVEQNGDG